MNERPFGAPQGDKSALPLLWALSMPLVLMLVVGCGVDHPRSTIEPKTLSSARDAFIRNSDAETEALTLRLVERLKRKSDDFAAGRTNTKPTLDVLILSGGADYGAFGAGFMYGWGSVPVNDPLARPTFDVITGVSTGSILAPFVCVGDEASYRLAYYSYQEPKKDWAKPFNAFTFLFGGSSLLDNDVLHQDINRGVTASVIRSMATAGREGRVVAIGATNIDFGRRRVWDLCGESMRWVRESDQHVSESGIDSIHKILLASSAMPVLFPAIEIDDQLYIDGAVTANILNPADVQAPAGILSVWRKRYPNQPPPQMRFWVVVNNQKQSQPRIVQPDWKSIAQASLETSVRASTWMAVDDLAAHLALLNQNAPDAPPAELRVVAIPDDWRPASDRWFDPKTMRSLAQLGKQMGADSKSWRSHPLLSPNEHGNEKR